MGINGTHLDPPFSFHGYDFALVVLKENITTSSKINVIKLPNENAKCPTGLKLKVSGWGNDLVRPSREFTTIWSVMQECFNISECTMYNGPKGNVLCIGDREMPLNSGCHRDSGGRGYLN